MIKWDETLWLFTVDEFNQLPDGIELTCIDGNTTVKGIDYIDMDTRGGHIAFGVHNPTTHPLAELFTTFKLKAA